MLFIPKMGATKRLGRLSRRGAQVRVDESCVVWRDVEDGVVVLDTRTSEYLALNRSGAFLWKALLSGATDNDLVENLQTTFGVPEQTATDDVGAFICKLREYGLLAN